MAVSTMIRSLAAVLSLATCVSFSNAAQTREIERTGGPYVPTPQVVVNEMLRFGRVGPSDYVMDLGSGDGVIVLTAARQLRASGVGIEIDPELVRLSNAEATKWGVGDKARFQAMDVFKADLSKATVVTLYLLPAMMLKLRDKIFAELRPGVRVVSHDYHFGDWQADDQVVLDVPEKELINGTPTATLYLWTIPAKVGGQWQIKVDGQAQQHDADFTQKFHITNGKLMNAQGRNISDVSVKGADISFSIWNGSVRHHYRGRVQGASMSGVVNLDGREGRWQAVRTTTFR